MYTYYSVCVYIIMCRFRIQIGTLVDALVDAPRLPLPLKVVTGGYTRGRNLRFWMEICTPVII